MLNCGHFAANRCRSCSQLQIGYDQQLLRKQAHCETLLASHRAVVWLPALPSALSGFRNRAKMVVSGSVEAPILGIVSPAGVAVDLRDCALYGPELRSSFAPIVAYLRAARVPPYQIETRSGEIKFALITCAPSGALMLRLVLRSKESLDRLRKSLSQLQSDLPNLQVVSVNLQPVHQAILEGPEEIGLTANQQLGVRVNELNLYLGPQSFFQTNTAVAEALYRQARAWTALLKPRSMLDLYCGVGGFALHCAQNAGRVTGVELSAQAIASAQRSAQEMPASYIQFYAADACEFALALSETPELVVVNPPRRGLGITLSNWLANSLVKWLIYSSCNTQSLAQDLARMPRFRLLQARVLDMFAHTEHYEVICLLERCD